MAFFREKSDCAALLFVLFCCTGQETRSTILGRITDPTGAVIPRRGVEPKKHRHRSAFHRPTNTSGTFLLSFLIPGPYIVTVEAPVLRNGVRSRIQARVRRPHHDRRDDGDSDRPVESPGPSSRGRISNGASPLTCTALWSPVRSPSSTSIVMRSSTLA